MQSFLLLLAAACLSWTSSALPSFPRMHNYTEAYIARELGHMANGTLKGSAVRDLAAAAWSLLALRNSTGSLSPSDVRSATSALEAVLAAQLPNGQWPWSFGQTECLDANSVQFTSLPLLLSIIHFGTALGSATVARWQPQLQAAASASFAEGNGPSTEAQPYYTNIATMRLVNLHLFAQVTGNASLRVQADAARSAWTDLVSASGLHEYASPTYSAVTIQNLAAGAAAVADAAVAAQLKQYKDFALAAAAVMLWGPAADMGGAHSRDYDFLFGSAGMAWVYALTGLSAAAGVPNPDLYALDADPITQAELLVDAALGSLGAASPAVAALAAPLPPGGAWRTARYSYLPTPGTAPATAGADATYFASAVATLGTASLYYGPQDKMVAAQLAVQPGGVPPAASPRLAQVTLVQDAFDAPYGRVETKDGSGHSKPTHLKATVAAVQDLGLALVLNDLTMAIESTSGGGPFTSLAANVVLPAGGGVAGLYVNGVKLGATGPGAPELPLALGDTVAVRSAGGIVAVRVPYVDSLGGYRPTAALRFDGPQGSQAARLVTYLYRGANVSFPASPPPSRSLLLVGVGAAGSDAEAASFSAALAALVVDNQAGNPSAWRVRVSPAQGWNSSSSSSSSALPPGFASTLEAELCVPVTKRILLRAINGSSVPVPRGGEIEVLWSSGRAATVTTAGIVGL
jgi:hypothetical protein